MKALSQPLFASLRGYDRAQLGPDLFSGVLIALLSIPISMGYAQLAGLPPVYGLYGSLVPILLFAMLSTTREFIFGVDAAPAAMIGAVLASLGVTPGGAEAMRIVPVLTLYVALWLAVFALVHADKAVDYISEPVMGVIEQICNRVAIIDSSCIAECGNVTDVFIHPQTAAARKLILPDSKLENAVLGKRCCRIVFDGNSSYEPVVANMVLETKAPVNILYASTKDIDGKAYGQILVQLPENEVAAGRMINYLDSINIHYEEEIFNA